MLLWVEFLARLVGRAQCRWVASLCALAFGSGCSGCDDGGFTSDAPPPDATLRGTVSLAWSLTDLTGRPISCDDIGASFVFLELRSQSGIGGSVASLACGNSPSTSSPIDIGTYDVHFELHGQTLTPVSAPAQGGVVISANQNTPLAPVTFVVDTSGRLVLGLTAPPTPSNCDTTNPMSAKITTTTITLVRASGGCAPVTFIRTRGAMTIGSYTVNCSSPPTTMCIENDETLTVSSMPSGPYTIHVRGKIGPLDCWVNDDALAVPAQGKALTETLNLAHLSTPGC